MATTAPPTTDLPAWLSNRGRAWKIAALTGLLLLGGWHLSWRLDRAYLDVGEMMADPAAHQGEDVLLGAFRVLEIHREESTDGSAQLWAPWTDPVVATPIPDELEVGHLASVDGFFHGEDQVVARRWKIHRRMKVKKAIGLAALVMVLALASHDLWTWRRRRA
jgi:hypothetical protein